MTDIRVGDRQTVKQTVTQRVTQKLARRDEIVETLHGIEVADPYRWLEDQESAETRAWIEAQDATTRAFLEQTPQRPEIRQRLTELARIDSVGMPTVRHGVYFFSKRKADEELPIFYRRVGIAGEDEVLIDPHTLSTDGSVSVSLMDISQDGSLLVYGIRHGGEDEVEVRLLDVATRTDLPERLPRDRYMSVALTPDKSTLYYSRETDNGPRAYRYRRPVCSTITDPALSVSASNSVSNSVSNSLSTSSSCSTLISDAEEIFGEGYEKGKYASVSVSDNGRYLLFTVYYGAAGSKTDLYLQLLTPPISSDFSSGDFSNGDQSKSDGGPTVYPIVPLITTLEARFYGTIAADRLYMQTNLDAPNERIIAVDLDRLDLTSASSWGGPLSPDRFIEILPTRQEAVLEGFSLAGGHVIANYLQDVCSHVQIFDAQGKHVRDIELPTLGSAGGPYGEWNSPETFYTFTSFAYPSVIYRYDLLTGATQEWARLQVPIDPTRFEIKQVFFTSKDGTRVPMFLMHLKNLPLDGARPTLIYGYGGFTASLTPGFSSFATLWAEHGGVYALANLRGGGEYGEAWHQGGMQAKKQNTFDDFYAAAEYLIDSSYTNPDKLAIMGGSNGGLLVGAALTQRPELFRAVLCAVPLLDMVRYHQFLVARYWIPEYGSSEDPEQFRTLYAYSPYHHVVPGTRYPAVLFVTGDADTRVAPLHARKMAALLQHANASLPTSTEISEETSVENSNKISTETGVAEEERPILLHYDTKSGHMGTKPLNKVIDDSTDQLCFLFTQLGV